MPKLCTKLCTKFIMHTIFYTISLVKYIRFAFATTVHSVQVSFIFIQLPYRLKFITMNSPLSSIERYRLIGTMILIMLISDWFNYTDAAPTDSSNNTESVSGFRLGILAYIYLLILINS